MRPTRWQAIWSVFYVVVTVGFATFVVLMDADPTAVFFGAAALLLVFYGLDLGGVELERTRTLVLRGSDADEREGDD